MAVTGRESVTVIDLHHLPEARPLAGEGHEAPPPPRRPRSLPARKIEPFVNRQIAGERIRATAENMTK